MNQDDIIKQSLEDNNTNENKIESSRKWYLNILFGIQHFLSMCTPNAMATIILADYICIGNDFQLKSELISSCFFVMGITTLLQTICGCKLPIIQGATFTLLVPIMAMMTLPEWNTCNISDIRYVQDNFQNASLPESAFHLKIRLINGAMIASSLLEILIPISGMLIFLRRLITPLSLASIYTVLCLAISENLIALVAKQWGIGILSMVVTTVFCVAMTDILVPIPTWWVGTGWKIRRIKIFQISPVILSIIIMWMICGILTATGIFSGDPNGWGYFAKTDINHPSNKTPIFKLPYMMKWGSPIMVPSIIIGFTIGIQLSIIESVGDYIITAKVSKAPEIPQFAINRGILVEGFGVFLSGLLGCVTAPTSYSENIALIKLTKGADLMITRIAALLMLVCGIFPFIGAIFVSIPLPIVGGVMVIVNTMIMSCAISHFHFINLFSTRNALVYGLSVAFGIYIPKWISGNFSLIATGLKSVDGVIYILLTINLFVVSVLSIVLDNVLPRKDRDRKSLDVDQDEDDDDSGTCKYTALQIALSYDPFLLKWIAKKCLCFQYLPLFPAYRNLEKHGQKVGEGNENKKTTI